MSHRRSWALILLILVSHTSYAGILTTKHNLSVSGPGNVKAVRESQV